MRTVCEDKNLCQGIFLYLDFLCRDNILCRDIILFYNNPQATWAIWTSFSWVMKNNILTCKKIIFLLLILRVVKRVLKQRWTKFWFIPLVVSFLDEKKHHVGRANENKYLKSSVSCNYNQIVVLSYSRIQVDMKTHLFITMCIILIFTRILFRSTILT